jgi:Ala-tRNA(Pro) deacylase
MSIAPTLQSYLSEQNIDYEVMTHERTSSSLRTAEASHVPGDCLAKGVVLSREGGYLLAVVPASRRVELGAVENLVHHRVAMATEDEVSSLFPDCEPGAIPPLGQAYALDCLIDDSLEQQPEIYLEAGDHRSLIHIPGTQFRELVKGMPHGHIGVPE